jgi:short-subunit dehydrogenase
MDGELRAVVTGGSSGIGAAFAKALARRGEKLVLVARRGDRLKELGAQLGGDPLPVALDLTAPGAVSQLDETLKSRGILVDLLVNNAGVGHSGAFSSEPMEASLGIVDLNVRSVVELTRRFLPGMLERKRGRIVNVVSVAAFQPVPYLTVYGASKAFVLSFTEGLAAEIEGSGVRIQSLCPGNTRTEFQTVAGTDRVLYDRTPALTPEEVAEASLKALDRRGGRVIPSLRDRALVGLQTFIPRGIVLRVTASLFRPKMD